MLYMILHALLFTAICASTNPVYNVMPDESASTGTCTNCKTLNHYLRNITKYFTSNSKFYFSQGTYQIVYNLILDNVPNISLIGDDPKRTVIKCINLVGIKMVSMTNLTLINLTMLNCEAKSIYRQKQQQFSTYYGSLILFRCYNVYLQNIHILHKKIPLFNTAALLAINVFGKMVLTGITSGDIQVYYSDYGVASDGKSRYNHTITISNFLPLYDHKETYDEVPYTMGYETENGNNQFSYDYDNNDCDQRPYAILPHTKINPAIDFAPVVGIFLEQNLFGVAIEIVDTTFTFLEYFETVNIKINSLGIHKNNVTFKNCTFSKNFYTQRHNQLPRLIMVELFSCITEDKVCGNSIVNFNNCTFSQNYYEGSLIVIAWEYENCLTNETVYRNQIKEQILIAHCSFEQNVLIYMIQLISSVKVDVIIHFVNTNFKNLSTSEKGFNSLVSEGVIYSINVILMMEGPISYQEINITNSLIYSNAEIIVTKNITFSNIVSESLVNGKLNAMISLISDVYINISNVSTRESVFIMNNNTYHDLDSLCLTFYLNLVKGKLEKSMPLTKENDAIEFHPLCFFQYHQYETTKTNTLIEIYDNKNNGNNIFDFITGNANCKFIEGSLYYGMNPLTVHQQHFQLINKTGRYPLFNSGLLCYCLDKVQSNCLTNTIGPLFPGESFEFHLMLNPLIVDVFTLPIFVRVVDQEQPGSVCKVPSLLQAEQLITKTCTKISYTILAENENSCRLILYSVRWRYPTIYYVKLRNCPFGFVFSPVAKSCICDSILTTYGIIGDHDCDINDQTILRPADSWISTTTYNDSYIYHISVHCPFHYCLPHSSHLNFSTPNSQCQFNRSGLLCGHCQQGLSTVFSSSHCKTCSDYYLFLIIPIIVIGFMLVWLLFLLNLTVTDGAVNGFILYANIISINTPILFPNVNHFTPAYTFISLANLDLGIQTCFYNGMDDYAKMWLQLAFPFYLIFIATLIIITSRYSTTIQRLTARRALPVLATLFLLSYTKILRIVSSVLFFYSTITHLPSKHTTLVWSVDANVPLFGVRFTILFIVCLILFLILVPFNIILLFTRTLSRFRFINKFRPLLDAYQGPYKIKFYYWTGLQLLIRIIFFGTSSLDRNLSLTVGITLFSLIEGYRVL